MAKWLTKSTANSMIWVRSQALANLWSPRCPARQATSSGWKLPASIPCNTSYVTWYSEKKLTINSYNVFNENRLIISFQSGQKHINCLRNTFIVMEWNIFCDNFSLLSFKASKKVGECDKALVCDPTVIYLTIEIAVLKLESIQSQRISPI